MRRRGLRTLTGEVVFATLADTLVSGVVLTAFALHLGASNALIGALAAVTFWSQVLQGPAVLLIDRIRMRKAVVVIASLVRALAPALMMALAFSAASPASRTGLVVAVALYGGAGAFAGCAWNPWIRDLVQSEASGRFTGRRSAISRGVSLAAGLAAAWLLDLAPEESLWRGAVFAGLFAVSFLSEVLCAAALSLVPEPAMPPRSGESQRLVTLLRRPLADTNFRKLVAFLASWQFAVNLAQPFFTVFFLEQLGFEMTVVMALSLVSMFANMLTVRRWGLLADRFTNKTILNLAAPVYILCIAGMVGASQFSSELMAMAYLVPLHLMMGVASAGVALASGNIAMKLSPEAAAEPYLAANALITSAAAGLAPVIGGLGADFFAERSFRLILEWTGHYYQGRLVHFEIRAWDFYFLLSALLGLWSLHRLALVQEEGSLDRRDLFREILSRNPEGRRRLNPVTGLEASGEVPPGVLNGRLEER